METFIGNVRDANERFFVTIPKNIVLVAGFKDGDLVRVSIEKAESIQEPKETAVKSDFGDR